MKKQEIRKRRRLTAEQKYSILEEIRRNPSKRSEILRREGLYSSDIQRFEECAREGAIKSLKRHSRPGPKKREDVSIKEYESIQRELDRKDKALSELSVEFTILKKKVNGV